MQNGVSVSIRHKTLGNKMGTVRGEKAHRLPHEKQRQKTGVLAGVQ